MCDKIPRIIHQTWINENIPEKWLISRERWILHHPSWKYMLWTDEDNEKLVKDKYPHLLEKYLSYPYGIQRADFIRPLILYEYGGIYSDLDIAPTKPFDNILDSDLKLLCVDGRFTNMLMATSKHHPFWLEVINCMLEPEIPWYAGTRHFWIQATTGPILLDGVAKREKITGDNLFDPLQVHPCCRCDKKPCTTRNAYVEMLDGGSWNEWDTLVIDTFCCEWDTIIVILALVIVLIYLIVYADSKPF